jgi:hypothetical protein
MATKCHYWERVCISAITAPPETFVYTLWEMDEGRHLESERVYAFGLHREQLFTTFDHTAILECGCEEKFDPTLAAISVRALISDAGNGDPLALVCPEDDCSNGEVVGLFTAPDTPSDKEIAWADTRLTEKITRARLKKSGVL